MTERRKILETFENRFLRREYQIRDRRARVHGDSVCPKTGQPDFGTMTSCHVFARAEKCVELKEPQVLSTEFSQRGNFLRKRRPRFHC